MTNSVLYLSRPSSSTFGSTINQLNFKCCQPSTTIQYTAKCCNSTLCTMARYLRSASAVRKSRAEFVHPNSKEVAQAQPGPALQVAVPARGGALGQALGIGVCLSACRPVGVGVVNRIKSFGRYCRAHVWEALLSEKELPSWTGRRGEERRESSDRDIHSLAQLGGCSQPIANRVTWR